MKTLKQKMIEKLYREHGIILDPCDLVSYRRNGYGSRAVSWATVRANPAYQSFYTMRVCLNMPTELVKYGNDRATSIEVDFGAAQIAEQS